MTWLAASPWQGGGGGFFPCGLIALLVIGGLIAGAFWWSRRRKGKPSGGNPSTAGSPAGSKAGSKAEDILAERYARGEMSDEEFMQRQSVLRDHNSSP